MLYVELQMPEILHVAACIDDSMSPSGQGQRNVEYATKCGPQTKGWIKFRTTQYSGHVPSHIRTLVRDDSFLAVPKREKDGDDGRREH
jgi:hypothetical protein